MRNLTITAKNPKIKAAFTGEQWQLYTDSMSCGRAAVALNAALNKAVNSGKTRDEVYAAVDAVRNKYADFGAADTEPRYVLEDALDAIFGKSPGEGW